METKSTLVRSWQSFTRRKGERRITGGAEDRDFEGDGDPDGGEGVKRDPNE
ncbi:hypothetical protein LINGRAHAP2_LOCUS20472, partial [Linum grandiflorum]